MSHQQAGPDREPARRFIAADHARAASPYANVSSAVHKTLPVARRTAMCPAEEECDRWSVTECSSMDRQPDCHRVEPWAAKGDFDAALGKQRRRRSRPDGSRTGLSWPFRVGRRRVKILQFRRIPGTSPSRYQTAPGALYGEARDAPGPGPPLRQRGLRDCRSTTRTRE